MLNNLLAAWYWNETLKIVCLVLACVSLAIVCVYLTYTIVKIIRQSRIDVEREEREPCTALTVVPPAPVEAPEEEQRLAEEGEVIYLSGAVAAPVREEVPPAAEPLPECGAISPDADVSVSAADLGGKRKTLADRLLVSAEETRGYFEEIKAFLARYSALRCIESKLYLTYQYKKRPVAKLTVLGKSALIYLPLDVKEYENSKYRFEDKSAVKSFANFPAELKVRSPRGLKYAKELLEKILADLGVEPDAAVAEDISETPAAETATEEKKTGSETFAPAREETVVNDSAAQGGLFAAAAASEAAELGGKRKTLQDRIAATSEEVKGYFEEITAFLAQFSAVAVLRGKLYLTYRWKKRAVVKCTVHGKAVVLHLALDPAAFADTKYRMEDKSGVQSFANFPAEFKVKSERSLKYGKELISYILENLGAIQGDKNAAAVRKEIGS